MDSKHVIPLGLMAAPMALNAQDRKGFARVPIFANYAQFGTSYMMSLDQNDERTRRSGRYGLAGNLGGFLGGMALHAVQKNEKSFQRAMNMSTAMGLAGNAYGAYKAQKKNAAKASITPSDTGSTSVNISKFVEDGATRYDIHDDNGKNVAYAKIKPQGKKKHIDGLWVHPEHRRQGLETALMRRIKDDYSDQELSLMSKKAKKVLNKPMRTPGGPKKFKVYVKDPSTGNVKTVRFGDPNMEIKRDNPERRKNFRARHNCDNPGPKTKARYWSCQATWSNTKTVGQALEAKSKK